MAFREITKTTSALDDLNQYAQALNGSSGKGQPLDLLALNSSTKWCIDCKNLDSGSKCLRCTNAAGTVVLLQVDSSGVRLSPDGATGGLIPVTTTGTETLTNKTLTMGGGLTLKQGSAITSAATIAPASGASGGNLFFVTGTTAITAITATAAGHIITLKFASAGCKVAAGATLLLNGDYFSLADSSLTLICDGTNWIELARSGHANIGAKVQRTTTQSINNSTATAVSWSSTVYDYGDIWVVGSPTRITVPCAGKYAVSGIVVFDNTVGDFYTQAWVYLNGAVNQKVHANYHSSNTAARAASFYTILDLAATNYLELFVWHNEGVARLLNGGTATTGITEMTVTRLGP